MNRMCRHLNFALRTLLLAWLCLGCGRNVRADAIMVTKAMNASTIAEVSVNDTFIRVDLEIGPADFAAFADILPDDLYEGVTGKREAARLRQVRFFERGLVLKADDQQISGRMIVLEKRRRIVRDAVTGQP
jgi:hypothetical protein